MLAHLETSGVHKKSLSTVHLISARMLAWQVEGVPGAEASRISTCCHLHFEAGVRGRSEKNPDLLRVPGDHLDPPKATHLNPPEYGGARGGHQSGYDMIPI